MRHRMGLESRQELLNSARTRYSTASRPEKATILNEFTAATALHRKYAIELLRKVAPAQRKKRASTPRKYNKKAQEALVCLWNAANRICSRRLVPFLPTLCSALERHGGISLSDEVRQQVLSMSPATVDRLLAPSRYGTGKATRRSKRRLASALRQKIPIRTFNDWAGVQAGECEADLVAHCGTRLSGSFLNSFVITDVVTGWTECAALLFKEQTTVVFALADLRKMMPLPLLSLDTDNGTEFINEVLWQYCKDNTVSFTRSRPYKKNDQCFIEQKNGSVVRRNVGYDRLEGLAACQMLAKLYSVLRLYINFFQPSMKLVRKRRERSKVHKTYDRAKTPYQRTLDLPGLSSAVRQRLEAIYVDLDPVALLAQLRACQDSLWGHAAEQAAVAIRLASADGQQPPPLPIPRPLGIPEEEERHWRESAKPRRKTAQPRWWKTRTDPFELVWDELEARLDGAPETTARVLLSEAQRRYPGIFPDALLRTLQRRVTVWRRARLACAAGSLVVAE